MWYIYGCLIARKIHGGNAGRILTIGFVKSKKLGNGTTICGSSTTSVFNIQRAFLSGTKRIIEEDFEE
jgi:hypothetical protein